MTDASDQKNSAESGRNIGTELDRKLIQHHHEIVMEQWRQDFEITGAVFRDQKDYAAMVLRGSLLINGAAAIALLAYIGRVAGTENGPDVSGAICALALFTVGIVVSVICVLRLASLQREYNKAHRDLLGRKKSAIKDYKKAVEKILDGEGAPTPKRPLKESHWNSQCLGKISNKMRCTITSTALLTLALFCGGVGTAAYTLSQKTTAVECCGALSEQGD